MVKYIHTYIYIYIYIYIHTHTPAKVGDTNSIPESERSPGERNGNPLQYSCLGNSMDREAWWAIVHGAAKEPDKT